MENNLYEMTLTQYTEHKINSSKYAKQMKQHPEKYNNDTYYSEWKNMLIENAVDNIIPEVVLRSMVNYLNSKCENYQKPINSVEVITRMFRGRTAKGAEAWLKAQDNKAPNTCY